MFIVTGSNGFIGTHLTKRLSEQGHDVLGVTGDHGTEVNFCRWTITKKQFLSLLESRTQAEFLSVLRLYVDPDSLAFVKGIVHLGACSDTMCDDWQYLGTNNYEYSVKIFEFIRRISIPFIYASSASTYGSCKMWKPSKEEESLFTLWPLNKYGWSKLLFDQYINAICRNENVGARWHGLRFFNVYGFHEKHKGHMSSMPYRFLKQGKENKTITIYDVEAYRDFVYVEDVVDVMWYLLFNPCVASGIYNVGSGKETNVRHVAKAAAEITGAKIIETIAPEKLLSQYQYFTQADIVKLRGQGFKNTFTSIENGMKQVFDKMTK